MADLNAGPPRRRTDPPRRFAVAEIPGGRLRVAVGAGRVELGSTTGTAVRVRATRPRWVSDRLAALVPAILRSPRYRLRGDGLHIRARRARLQIDLPPGLTTLVQLRRGEITSWGAAGELSLFVADGVVTCRELQATAAHVRAPRASLHFASSPERVEVFADRAVVAVPAGAYAVSAPDTAEVTVPLDPASARVIVVRAAAARVLAAADPLRLTDEQGVGS